MTSSSLLVRAAVGILALVLAVVAPAAPVAAVYTAEIAFSQTTNITLTNSTQYNTLAYRAVAFQTINAPGLIEGFFSESAQASATGGTTSGTFKADLVVGGFVSTLAAYPFSFGLYFDDEGLWTASPNTNFLTDLLTNSHASGGVGVTVFISVNEVNPSGNIVATVDFKSIFGSLLGISSGGSNVHLDATGNLKSNWVATTYQSATYNFSYIASQVLGKLTLGADMTPKSTDVLLQINNYQYANAANHLRLNYATGYAVFSWDGTATIHFDGIVTGNAPNSVYVSNSEVVSVSGNLQSATVSVTGHSDLSGVVSNDVITTINTYINNVQGNKGYAVASIDFPAGAANIAYDPQTGFEPPQTNNGGNSGNGNASHLSALVMLLALAIALVFVAL